MFNQKFIENDSDKSENISCLTYVLIGVEYCQDGAHLKGLALIVLPQAPTDTPMYSSLDKISLQISLRRFAS
jgi:hypothetical protein